MVNNKRAQFTHTNLESIGTKLPLEANTSFTHMCSGSEIDSFASRSPGPESAPFATIAHVNFSVRVHIEKLIFEHKMAKLNQLRMSRIGVRDDPFGPFSISSVAMNVSVSKRDVLSANHVLQVNAGTRFHPA